MRVLITGHDGYLGRPIAAALGQAGHTVRGIDAMLFSHTTLGPIIHRMPEALGDVRDIGPEALDDVDAVVHLAGVPEMLGGVATEVVEAINHEATVRLAELCAEAGLQTFVRASHRRANGQESAAPTATDAALTSFAAADFRPLSLVVPEAYGFSPALRGDLLVNNMVGHAVTAGEVPLYYDPETLVAVMALHDVAQSFVAALDHWSTTTPSSTDCLLSAGAESSQTSVGKLVETITAAVDGARVVNRSDERPIGLDRRPLMPKGMPQLPGFQTTVSLEAGIQTMVEDFGRYGLARDDLSGARFNRTEALGTALRRGHLDDDLRPVPASIGAVA